MYKFCPRTGTPLQEMKFFGNHWCILHRGPLCAYLEVLDGKFCFPLMDVPIDLAEKMSLIPEEKVGPALKKIRRIDASTVSIVEMLNDIAAL